jgi:hypothetical protein
MARHVERKGELITAEVLQKDQNTDNDVTVGCSVKQLDKSQACVDGGMGRISPCNIAMRRDSMTGVGILGVAAGCFWQQRCEDGTNGVN